MLTNALNLTLLHTTYAAKTNIALSKHDIMLPSLEVNSTSLVMARGRKKQ
ncbi:hypothetical protein [Shewanella vesiculosa]|nr:hypothetical protein [Shewanella vesiculosa]NCP73265.1 hypothetical protein [Shewanella vesiculosa]NCP92681.1 hypothetical protein [Shewanella vesiculosa]